MVEQGQLNWLKWRAWFFGIALFLLPVVVGAGVYLATDKNRINTSFTDATAAITFITAAAVAIERLLEGFWSLLNMKTPWWPMSAVTAAVSAFEKEANAALKEPLADLETQLKAAVAKAEAAGDDVTAAKAALGRYQEAAADAKRRANVLKSMAPGNERLSLTTGYIQAAADAAAQVFKETGAAMTTAGTALGKAAAYGGSATDLVAAFRENPARRVLSLSIGTTVGLVISGLFGLNIFLAAAEAPPEDTNTESTAKTASVRLVADAAPGTTDLTLLEGVGGVVLTGIIIGLGSGPTHEVIRLVQESKRGRRQELSVGGTESTSTDETKVAVALPTTDQPEVKDDAKPEVAIVGAEGAGDGGKGGGTPSGGVVTLDSGTKRMLRPTRLTSTE